MPWPLNLTRSSWRKAACANMNFLRQGFRKLPSGRHTYIHTCRQTDRETGMTKIIYHAASRVLNKNYWFPVFSLSCSTIVNSILWVELLADLLRQIIAKQRMQSSRDSQMCLFTTFQHRTAMATMKSTANSQRFTVFNNTWVTTTAFIRT